MGDVSCVILSIHPYTGGAKGPSHSSEYCIVDPVLACVTSAKVQLGVTVRLLEDDAAEAKKVLAEKTDYPTIAEYLAQVDANCIDQQAVLYQEDGTVVLQYQ